MATLAPWRLILFIGVIACSDDAKRETASLATAMDRYQRAEPQQKETAAADVRAVVCGNVDVVAAKAACVVGIDSTMKALVLKHEVEVGLDDLEQNKINRDDPRAQELPQKVEDAQRLLLEGRASMKACDQKLLALRMKHGV